MMKRPSVKELHNKVTAALCAIKAGRCQIGTPRHWVGDLEDLDLDSVKDLWLLLPDLLLEIAKQGPSNCYAGTSPPQRSYEEQPWIKGEELWAYSWNSTRLKRKMYLKFVLTKNRTGEWHYYYIDCHTSTQK